MSQQQTFSGANSPVVPDIEFIQGTSGTPAGANPATFTVDFTSSEDDLSIVSDAVTYSVDFIIKNRVRGSATTVNVQTSDIITFPLGAVPGVYKFHFEVAAFSPLGAVGLGYSIEASARTDGAVATIIETPDGDEDEDGALSTADWNVIASGNDLILQGVGVNTFTINWSALGTYIFRS